MRAARSRAVTGLGLVLALATLPAALMAADSTHDKKDVSFSTSSPAVPLPTTQRAALEAKRMLPVQAPAPIRTAAKATPIVTITASGASAPSLDPSIAQKKLAMTTLAGAKPGTTAFAPTDPHVLDVVRWMLGLDAARQAGLAKSGDRVVSKPREAQP